MACVMDLNALRQETLASALTTTAQDGATAFGLHAGTEAELAFARALGWLVGALHVVRIFKSRTGCPKAVFLSTGNIGKSIFLRNPYCSADNFILASHLHLEVLWASLVTRLGS